MIISLPPTSADRRLERRVLITVLALLLLRALTAHLADLSSDEAYYWHWIHPLQLSYFDHPAMVAAWIWAGVRLAGESSFGVRLPALLGGLATTILVWDSARLVFRSRRVAAWAALWLNASVLFNSAGVVVTPGTPLLVFWALALWAALKVILEGDARFVLLTGLALGLGAISKYTIALILPGLVLTFLLFAPLRVWWRRPVTLGAALLAAVCTLPLWIWNAQNGFASFHKQLDHAFDTPPQATHALANLGAFLGSQIGLVTPLLFGFCLWGMGWALWRGWRERRPEWFLLGATSLPIILFFAQHSLDGLVQAHWDGPAYLSGVIATAGAGCGLRRPLWRRLFLAAPLLGLALSLLVLFQAATALLPLPVRIDPLKRLGGWSELARAVEAQRLLHPGAFLLTPKHEPTGPLSFHLPGHPPVFLEGHIRPSYYSAAQVAALKGRDAIIITQSKDDGVLRDMPPYFDQVTLLGQVDLHWGGRVADRYTLYLGRHYHGGLLTMGNGWNGGKDTPGLPASP